MQNYTTYVTNTKCVSCLETALDNSSNGTARECVLSKREDAKLYYVTNTKLIL